MDSADDQPDLVPMKMELRIRHPADRRGRPETGREDPDAAADRLRTATPIKHVIVLIGENWSFDSLYATFRPRFGQSVQNLLSRGIVNADGTPGPNYPKARQM